MVISRQIIRDMGIEQENDTVYQRQNNSNEDETLFDNLVQLLEEFMMDEQLNQKIKRITEKIPDSFDDKKGWESLHQTYIKFLKDSLSPKLQEFNCNWLIFLECIESKREVLDGSDVMEIIDNLQNIEFFKSYYVQNIGNIQGWQDLLVVSPHH